MPRNCELCGSEIPEMMNACPSCGLRIDYAENRPDAEEQAQGAAPPDNQQADGQPPAGSDSFAGLNQEPGSPLDYPYANTGHTQPQGIYQPAQPGAPGGYGYSPPPPGAWPPSQPGAPGGSPPLPPGYQVSGAWGAPPGGYGPAAETGEKKNFPIALVVIFAIGFLILGGSAFAYFAFLKPASTNDAATSLVGKYLNAVGSGDAKAVASLHTPETQPNQDTLSVIQMVGGMMKSSYSDLRVEEISSTSDEMEVKITGAKLTMEMGGQKESVTLKELKEAFGDSISPVTVKLKRQNGQWLVNQTAVIDPFAMQFDSSSPTIPSTGSS